MRNTIAAAILLVALSNAPAVCQTAAVPQVLPAVPEVAAIVNPAPPAVEWTSSVAPTIAPIPQVPAVADVQFQAPAPAAVPTAVPAPVSDSKSFETWAAAEAKVEKVSLITRHQDEFVTRMANRQVFKSAPVNALGVPMVPEPGSIVALAVGLSGMAATIYGRRRGNKL